MKKRNSFSFLCLGVCVFVVLLLLSGGQQTASAQRVRIIATDGIGTDTVYLGLRADATNNIDTAIGESERPPNSPSFNLASVSNTHTIGRDTCLQGVLVNYHHLVSPTQQDQWKIAFTSDPVGGPVSFTWSWASNADRGANGWEIVDGAPVPAFESVDMVKTTSFTYPGAATHDVQYIYVNYYDGASLRTFTSTQIALAVDQKGKNDKSEKAKPNKAQFCFTFPLPAGVTSAAKLHVEFGNAIADPATLNFAPFTNAVSADPVGKQKKWDFSGATANAPVQISGWSIGGKAQKIGAFIYDANPKQKGATAVACTTPGSNVLLLPMPTVWNVIEELYAQHVYDGNLLAAKAAGLTVGVASTDGKLGKIVYHPKPHDIFKTLNKKGTLQANPARCLDKFDKDGKDILKPQKSLPPDKHNNKLLGDAVAFRVNLGIDQAGKTYGSAGILSTLTYNKPGNPFDGMTVAAINGHVDSLLACSTDDTTGTSVHPVTPAELDEALADINAAFSDPLQTVDTVGWSGVKVVMTGAKYVGKDGGLLTRSTLDAAPVMVLPSSGVAEYQKPDEFKLSQNYPNPFNPTTTIEFQIPDDGIVSLRVYNMLGQEVATLIDHEQMDGGAQAVEFDASALATGVYYYRLVLNDGEFTAVKKMMLLK